MAAGRGAVGDDAAVLDAVGAREDEGERQVLDGTCGAVAGKGCDMHLLAGAVDAALGPGIDVERAGRGAAGDAAVGQVEAGAGHVEEDEILVAVGGHQHGRHHAAFAARQAGIEAGAALGVGLRRAEDLVVPGQQRQVDAGDRQGGGERAGKDGEPVLAGVGRQADVGNDEPLRGARLPGLAAVVLRRRGHDVDAGLAVGQRLVDREAGGDFLVELVGDDEFALPYGLAHLVADRAHVVAVDLAQELVAGDELRQRAVADAEELDVGDVHVDGDDRDAAPRRRGQHEGIAGEAGRWGAVLDVDRQHDRRFQHLADGGRQAGAEGDAVLPAVLEPADADLAALRLDALRCRLVDGDEGGIVDADLDEVLGELGADARRDGVGLDRVLDDAETLARLEILVFGANQGGIDQREACLIGLQRRAEEIAAVEADGECCKDAGADRRGARDEIGIVAGRGDLGLQRAGFLVVDAAHGLDGAGKVEPEGGIVGLDAHGGGEFLHGGTRIAGEHGIVAGLGERRHAFLARGLREDALAHGLCLRGHPVGEPGNGRRGAEVGIAGERHDLAGDGAGKRLQRREIGLEEAPLCLGVVGEGATLAVAEAGSLALVERDVLLGTEVETEIVAVRRGDDLAGLDGEGRRHEDEEEEPENRKPVDQPHDISSTRGERRTCEAAQASPKPIKPPGCGPSPAKVFACARRPACYVAKYPSFRNIPDEGRRRAYLT